MTSQTPERFDDLPILEELRDRLLSCFESAPSLPSRERLVRARRWRPLAVIAVLVLGGTTAALGAAGVFRDLPPQAVLPATFSYLPKTWSTDSDELGVLSHSGAHADALALSWHYQPGWPTGPVGQLSKNRILVSVYLFRARAGSAHVNLCATTPHLAGYPARLPPLQLPRATTQTLDATPNVPEYRVFGRYRDYYNFEIRVDIANPEPAPALWHLADRIVAGIVLPPWPLRRTCPRTY